MKKITTKIKDYLEERGWENSRPGDFAKSISIESAELLELFQWSDPSSEEIKANPEKLKEVKMELADVFIYALDLSVILDIDPEEIITEKLKEVKKNYPAEESKAGGLEKHLELKAKHRERNNS